MAQTISRIFQLSLLGTFVCSAAVASKRPVRLILPSEVTVHQPRQIALGVQQQRGAMVPVQRPSRQQYQLVKSTRELLDQHAVVSKIRPTQLCNHIRATLSPRPKKQNFYSSSRIASSQPNLPIFPSNSGPLSPMSPTMPHKVTSPSEKKEFIRTVSQNVELRRSIAQPVFHKHAFSDLVNEHMSDRRMNTPQKIHWLEMVYYACHETQPFFPNIALDWYNDNQERIDQNCDAFFDLYDQMRLLRETVEPPVHTSLKRGPHDLITALHLRGLHINLPEEYRAFWSDVAFLLGSQVQLAQFVPYVIENIEAILPVYFNLHAVELTPDNVLPNSVLARLPEFNLVETPRILAWLEMVHTFLDGVAPLYKSQALLWAQQEYTKLNEFCDDIFSLYSRILSLRWDVVASSQYTLPPSSKAEGKLLRILAERGVNIQAPEHYAQFLNDIAFLLDDSLSAEAYLAFLLDDSTEQDSLGDILHLYFDLSALQAGHHLRGDDDDDSSNS